MTKIRFDTGNTVTIRDGFIEAASPTMTGLLNALVDSLPGEPDDDIARALIEKIGFGVIVAPIYSLTP